MPPAVLSHWAKREFEVQVMSPVIASVQVMSPAIASVQVMSPAIASAEVALPDVSFLPPKKLPQDGE